MESKKSKKFLVFPANAQTQTGSMASKLLKIKRIWRFGLVNKLTWKDEVQIYDRNRPLAFWKNQCVDLGHECTLVTERNCVFADIVNNISCQQRNMAHLDTWKNTEIS